MGKIYFKWGLAAVIIAQIISIFYLMNVYDKFVSNPDNYYKNILASKDNQ
ncbi:MAG: hypothetical protein UV36_C0039G0011 [Parcubacteria group bacterium GW2011_GWC2_42_6]|nr:MAG: hypothetical protein UV36_C0039G0011 [Parcubacteria group bacterium GW2011_GWC2_42_6]